jgi:hypothetical protein
VNATSTVDSERARLAGVVKDIRETQIPALKDRELTMLSKIDEVRQTESPAITTARLEIQRLRESAERQVEQSQSLIKRLQEQLANSDNADDVQKSIDEQNERVRSASFEIDRLTEERIILEAEYRKLEAEVGPVKYIAEFVYGEQADKSMLEEAVRWVILIIIFVFDPLAVLLLIASQYTFEFRKKRKDDDGGWLRQYEQARAQRIVDNPGFTVDDLKEDADENNRRETREEESQNAEELRTGQNEESVPSETGVNPVMAEEEKLDVAKSYITTDDVVGDDIPEADTAVADVPTFGMEPIEVQSDEDFQGKIDGGLDTIVSSADSAGAGDNGGDTSNGMALAGEDRTDELRTSDTRNKFIYDEENKTKTWLRVEDSKKKTYITKQDGIQIKNKI